MFKKVFKLSILVLVVTSSLVYFSNKWIINSTKNDLHTSLTKLPTNDVGLVLGASKTTFRGTTNLYFRYRMEAAAHLYHTGKIKHILVSGDNHIEEYDEATDMRDYLIKLGVPASKITLDYAGFRTLDSVVRCKEVFGQDKVTIISQEFHNQRAVFIAKQKGIDACGYNAKDVPKKYSYKTTLREYLAKTKAVLDLFILMKKPKFLGEKVRIS